MGWGEGEGGQNKKWKEKKEGKGFGGREGALSALWRGMLV